MKLFALLLIAFVVLLVTADAHDDQSMLQSGRREGNAPVRPATMPDDKKAQEEKKARDEKELKEQKNSTNSTTSKPPSLPTVVGDPNAKKARDNKKAQEKKEKPYFLLESSPAQANRDPNAISRFATDRPSPSDR